MPGRKCKYFEECHDLPVVFIPYASLRLCADHFYRYIEKRVQETIEKYHMISSMRPEKVLVALSGGKDSSVLLQILHKLYHEKIIIEALYIDLGIGHSAYSTESSRVAAAQCKTLNVPFHVVDIKKDYGFDMDQLYQLKMAVKEEKISIGSANFRGMCSYCGNIKRYVINKFAAEHGFTKVATGHNLTDEVTALMINFFNQDLRFLSRTRPMMDSGVDMLVPRIKPLYYIAEQEIIQYAYHAKIDHEYTACEYAENSPNLHIKQILQDMENDRKGLMLSLMRQYQKVLLPLIEPHQRTSDKKREIKCTICGMPTTQKKCSFCRNQRVLLDRIRQLEKLTHPDMTVNSSDTQIIIKTESECNESSEIEDDIDFDEKGFDQIDSELNSQDEINSDDSDQDMDDEPSNSED